MSKSTISLTCFLLTFCFFGLQPIPVSGQASPRIQFVHNSPEPLLDTLDVWFDTTKVINNLPFQSATPFRSYAPDSNFTISLAPSGSERASEAIVSFPNSFLVLGTTLVITVTGVDRPSVYAPNPNGRYIGLNLHVNSNAREEAPNDNSAFFSVWNAATDVEAARIFFPELNTALNDHFLLGDFTGYTGLEARPYTVIFEPADDSLAKSIRTFDLNLTGREGTVSSVFLTGFRRPADNQGGPELSLLVVDTNGRVESQTVITVDTEEDDVTLPGQFQVQGNYPNPFRNRTTLSFDLAQGADVQVEVFDALGRQVWTAPTRMYPAGRNHSVALHTAAWAPGLYLYRVSAQGPTTTHTAQGPMMLVR